jgi:uncharacterized membrane protein YbaN (DUF454 family)
MVWANNAATVLDFQRYSPQTQASCPPPRKAFRAMAPPAVHHRAGDDGAGPGPRPATGVVRYLLVVLGVTCVGLGAAGAVLPVLPTTPFLLVAAWAFARSSRRLRVWLYGHPRFGPTLVAWHEHRAVPRRAKVMAVGLMLASLTYVAVTATHPGVPIAVGLMMACVACFLLTRPDAPPPQ